jgi:hypothetical protein
MEGVTGALASGAGSAAVAFYYGQILGPSSESPSDLLKMASPIGQRIQGNDRIVSPPVDWPVGPVSPVVK